MTSILLIYKSVLTVVISAQAQFYALDWYKNEIQYQYGKLDIPEFSDGGSDARADSRQRANYHQVAS